MLYISPGKEGLLHGICISQNILEDPVALSTAEVMPGVPGGIVPLLLPQHICPPAKRVFVAVIDLRNLR